MAEASYEESFHPHQEPTFSAGEELVIAAKAFSSTVLPEDRIFNTPIYSHKSNTCKLPSYPIQY